MTVIILDKDSKNYPDSIAITFILTNQYLITIRYDELKSFEYFNSWIFRNKKKKFTCEYILINIMDFIINNHADILEEVGNDLDSFSGCCCCWCCNHVLEGPGHTTVPSRTLKKAFQMIGHEYRDCGHLYIRSYS